MIAKARKSQKRADKKSDEGGVYKSLQWVIVTAFRLLLRNKNRYSPGVNEDREGKIKKLIEKQHILTEKTENHRVAHKTDVSDHERVLVRVSLIAILPYENFGKEYCYKERDHPGAYAIQNSWVENTVNYNSNLGISSYLLDSRTFNYNSSVTYLAPGTKPFLITSAISDYYNKGTAFNGIALKALSTNSRTVWVSLVAST